MSVFLLVLPFMLISLSGVFKGEIIFPYANQPRVKGRKKERLWEKEKVGENKLYVIGK